MRLIIFILLVITIFSSCNNSNKEKEIIEDYAIYNQILYQLEHYGFYIFGNPVQKSFNYSDAINPYDSIEYNEIVKRLIKNNIDTSNFHPAGLVISIVSDSLNGRSYEGYIEQESVIFDTRKINQPRLSLLVNKSDNIFNPDSNRHFVFYSLSRIILNKEKNKGFFYISYQAAPLIGSGDEFKIELRNGAWFIVEHKKVWVS